MSTRQSFTQAVRSAAASQAVRRAIEMLRVAADHCDEYATHGTTFYDDAECDGSCVADDCRAAAEDLEDYL